MEYEQDDTNFVRSLHRHLLTAEDRMFQILRTCFQSSMCHSLVIHTLWSAQDLQAGPWDETNWIRTSQKKKYISKKSVKKMEIINNGTDGELKFYKLVNGSYWRSRTVLAAFVLSPSGSKNAFFTKVWFTLLSSFAVVQTPSLQIPHPLSCHRSHQLWQGSCAWTVKSGYSEQVR